MRRLPLFVILLQGSFLGIGPVAAQQLLALPSGATAAQLSEQLLTKSQVKAEQSEPSEDDSKDNEGSQLQPFDRVIKNTEKLEGLFTLYRNKKTDKIYLEIKPEQLNKNYLTTITMESGIGERGIYSGMPLQDLLFYFRQVNNNLHFVIRNVNFRTSPGDPQARSVERSFTDSVLYSLKIKSIHQQRKTILIDLSDLLLTDLPGLSSMLKGVLDTSYRLDGSKSYFGSAKTFPLNMEIDSVYGFSSSGGEGGSTPTLPDSRALTIRVHYSLSQLPENNGYRPRLADDRVGYFTTTYQDISSNNRSRDLFVRYINRWSLEKQDPSAPMSPPKKPIVFWIENTVPLEYRDAIREGVLMWNQAFEKAGFKDAIEVRQMPDNATWEPADVRYNTIRWLNSLDGEFALGPSRVNPLTGEILDADIIVDAGLVRVHKQMYRAFVPANQSSAKTSLLSSLMENGSLCSEGESSSSHQRDARVAPHSVTRSLLSSLARDSDLCFGRESANQMAIGSVALSLLNNGMPSDEEMKKYMHQFVRSLIAHEVGHTLGLRHNFRGSTLLKPEELNNIEITRTTGLSSSVMDYLPVNLAPPGTKQGDYFTRVVGPYDQWAIEYGYKPSKVAIPQAEKRFLEEIAQRQATNPGLSYAPDEDSFDLDPTANRYDMSSDPLRYSQWQLDNDRAMWERLSKLYPSNGGSYDELSDMFETVFVHYLQNVYFITKYVGGQSFHRDHAGDGSGRLPFEQVPLSKQREALIALQKYVFAENAFNFSPELLNKLAPSRWLDWGNNLAIGRLDFPVQDRIFFPQSLVLRKLLSGDRLKRLSDIELKTQPGQALTLPELFNTLQAAVWSEVLQNDKPVKISTSRRALQREHLEITIGMVLRNQDVPEDARTLAWEKLRQLRENINGTLRKGRNLDDYTKAHLEESRARITKALDAQLQSQ